MWHWFKMRFLTPKTFYLTSSKLLPWLVGIFIVCCSYGIIAGLFIAPKDYQQGDGFRIIYVHVPSAFTAMIIYTVMACSGAVTLIWRIKLAPLLMKCSAPIGASFTIIALITGAIWGKPMWGTFWIWDARLTSFLILLFLYFGFLALQATILNRANQDRACSILAVVGFMNIPIIHYSVIWWNTLHQGPTLSKFSKPTMAASMLYPLLSMILSFLIFYSIIVLLRMRSHILLEHSQTLWVKKVMS